MKFWKREKYSRSVIRYINENYWRQSDAISSVGTDARKAHRQLTAEYNRGYQQALSDEMVRVDHLITSRRQK